MGEVFRIAIDLAHLIPESAPLNRDTFPALAHAVETVTAAAHDRWSAFARGVPLPDGKIITNRTGEYLRSIQVRSLGDFAGEVFSELPYAAAIETGAPARDMKRMLDSSLKVRLTKDGRRYLIIPFRHDAPTKGGGSPSAMPAAVYRWWKHGQESSAVTGRYLRQSGTGAYHWRDGVSTLTGSPVRKGKPIFVNGWRYKWGSRLGAADIAGLGIKDEGMAKRLQGMVRFQTPGKTGGRSNTKFLTFRVMMEGSKGWIMPAREGLFPARTTSQEIAPVATELFREAAERDIRALLGGEP